MENKNTLRVDLRDGFLSHKDNPKLKEMTAQGFSMSSPITFDFYANKLGVNGSFQ